MSDNQKKISIGISMSPVLIENSDKRATALGWSRSKYISDLVRKDLKNGGYMKFNSDESERHAEPDKPLVMREWPFMGSAPCGFPIEVEEETDQTVRLQEDPRDPKNGFVIRAIGDSLVDIGIESGDYLVIRRAEHCSDGDIVVALVDNETTVKIANSVDERFTESGAPGWALRAANIEHPDPEIHFSLDIQGVVVRAAKK